MIFYLIQYLLPHHLCSRIIGYLANSKLLWLKNFLITQAVKTFKINLKEAEFEKVEDYPTFNAFFIRRLKTNARQISCEPNVIIYPVDGKLAQFGHIKNDSIIVAKRVHYTLKRLLTSEELVHLFKNGSYFTLYLSPQDYHRVHMPFDGKLIKTLYIPGALFSVNPKIVSKIPDLFAKNERLVCLFETEFGIAAIIFIGAMLVAGIHTVWAGQISSSKNKHIDIQDFATQSYNFKKGEEIGHFQFGSSVIMLLPTQINFLSLQPNSVIRMGQKLASIHQTTN